jgi:hypothetical protein
MASGIVRICMCVLLAATMGGCATTYTDDLATGTVAATLQHPGVLRGGVTIEQLDGHPLGVRPVESFTIAPGEHALLARANVAFHRSGEVTRWFDAAPGGRYRITAEVDRDEGAWGFGVIDESTGQRVDRAYSTRD